MKSYFYDNLPGDQRLDHNSGKSVSVEELERIGVVYRHLTTQDQVEELVEERGYKNRDVINVSPESLTPEAYNERLSVFFAEHLHDDEEIRYILDGRGFFDVRSGSDEWIRCAVEKDDLLILPAGIYHRFSTDTSDYIKAMRLFQDEPKWVAKNRPADGPTRKQYVASIKAN